MATLRVYYFDDSGDRGSNEKSPWLVVSGFGINAQDIPRMAHLVRNTAQRFGMTLEYPSELKFYHVGKENHDKKRKRLNWMLEAGLEDRRHRRALVLSCLRSGLTIPSIRVLTAAVKRSAVEEGKVPIVEAMRLLLDRAQIDCQEFGSHGLVFMDEELAADQALREAMRTGSTLIKNYNRMLDTIAFLPSQESPGIQLADLVAGSMSRYLNSKDPGYARVIWPRLRHKANNQHQFGIISYPTTRFSRPPAQIVPWPETDRRVLEYEIATWNRQRVNWSEDGQPDQYFPPLDPVLDVTATRAARDQS